MAATNDGIRWQTKHNENYFVKPDHRNGGWRSQWDVAALTEVQIFEHARDMNWGNGTIHWGLYVIDGSINRLGTKGEFISKHRRSLPTTEWHGYPAQPSPSHHQDYPPDEILESWRASRLLGAPQIKRLHRGIWTI